MRRILIRFDDICPAMDWNQWKKAEEIVDKYCVKPLIGIIPDCKDPDLMPNVSNKDFWEYIRKLQEKGYTIALHGFNHVYLTKSCGMVALSKHSEYAGLTVETQYEMIMHGKKILNDNGIETDIFFAPAHSYDRNTLKALKLAGFKYISDGKSLKPYMQEGIRCMPCRSGGVPKIIFKSGNYTAVFHTTEWRKCNKNAYEKLNRICQKYRGSIVSFETYCNQNNGVYMIQKAIEKSIVTFQRYILPILVNIKHVLKNLWGLTLSRKLCTSHQSNSLNRNQKKYTK